MNEIDFTVKMSSSLVGPVVSVTALPACFVTTVRTSLSVGQEHRPGTMQMTRWLRLFRHDLFSVGRVGRRKRREP